MMPAKLLLTPELRTTLKQPLGVLIRGSTAETIKKLKEMVAEERPRHIIAVGDIVSKNLAKSGFCPALLIIDNKSKRKKIRPTELNTDQVVHVRNPNGTITDEAETAIVDALNTGQHVKIIVDGEEDLLTLVAIANASSNSYVIYGQPYEGIVVVKVTASKKAEVARILESMERPSKAK
jgi:uncharacterized protein (UPF0218 family)